MDSRVLPENWDAVCLHAVGLVLDYQVMHGDRMNPSCLNCPLSRLIARGRVYDYYRCQAVDKCIKEYPPYKDKKEFL